MKRLLATSILSTLLTGTVYAIDSPGQSWGRTGSQTCGNSGSPSSPICQLKQDLDTLGSYLGFDITTPLSNSSQYVVSYLLMYNQSSYNPYAAYTSLAITAAAAATSLNPSYTSFAPYGTDSFLINQNTGSNSVYGSAKYDSASTSNISVNALVDQQGSTNYQSNPTSQAIQNLFITPDVSLCESYDDDGNITSYTSNCSNVKSQYQVMMGAIGVANIGNYVNNTTTLSSLFTGDSDYFTQFNPQLNANNLLGPLLYDTSSQSQDSTSSSASSSSTTGPLTANNQAQQAQNYVRFASGQVLPMNLPSTSDLNSVTQLMSGSDSQKQQGQAQWGLYMASLTTYAAQLSVVYSNLNSMMAKRMQIAIPSGEQGSSGSPAASQALYEYQMATWRLNDSTKQTDPAWLASVANASSATVAKEQLALLAEINYQLYLNRQMQEKVLLTNSMMLMQNMMFNRNNISLSSSSASATTNPTTGTMTSPSN